MRLTATATKLKPLINASAKLAPGTGKRPQLECTKIDVLGDRAIFSATNLIETARLTYSGEMTGEDGSVYLPSVNLQRVIREAKREDVTIEWDGKTQKASASFGSVRVSLPVEPPGNLPNIPGFDDKSPSVSLPASALAGTFARTAFAVQASFMARALSGVSLKITRGQLEAAATDGRAIAIVRVDIVNPTLLVTDALLPPISHKAISWIALDEQAAVDLQVVGSTLRLRGPDGELSWRMLSGKFPDYEGHVPERQLKAVEVDRRDLLALLDKAKLLKVVSLPEYMFTARQGELELLASAGIDGTVRASLAITWSWPDLEMSLDPGLLEAAVKAMSAEKVSVEFDSAEKPVLLREVTTQFDNRYAVIPRFK